jgi:transcriptional regulator with XRE-family HTH domain
MEYADIIDIMNTEQLRTRLRKAGIHQSDIAHKLGIHRTLFNKMLKGHRTMSESIYYAADEIAHELIMERIKVLANIDEH